ncbi:MAG: winged helix-turn-helix domain-containing protein [Gammaproteobacteria bacterium]|nr:winged helix-turn-helix domain-containing protein [Gammaproteobacteria bacterium]
MNIQDIANFLGVSRENISRIISKWIKLKIISKQNNNIIILDANMLRDIASNTVNPPGFSGHAAE